MNMQAILKQAQSLQRDMQKEQEKIEATTFEGENALVKVKVNGKKEILEVNIDKSATLESDDIEALQDMIMLAVNDAMKKVDKMTQEKMGKFANGMPGLF